MTSLAEIMNTTVLATSCASGALDAVGKAAGLFSGTKGSSEQKAALANAMERVLATQKAISALTDQNRALQEENARLKKFDAERDSYELRPIADRSFAYVKKDVSAADKNAPYYCAACFDDCQKSILQLHEQDFGRDKLRCNRCGAIVFCANDRKPLIATIPRQRVDPYGSGW